MYRFRGQGQEIGFENNQVICNTLPSDLTWIDQICGDLETIPNHFYQVAAGVYERYLVTVELQGGLGNQLFQLAAADYYARTHHKTCVISLDHIKPNPHSTLDYTIFCFTGFPIIKKFPANHVTSQENPESFSSFRPFDDVGEQHVLLKGYFQSIQYILPHFKQYLSFPISPKKGPSFLHVRRGDFLHYSIHNVNLICYFQEAIRQHRNLTILSDDLDWCRKQYMFSNCAFLECKNELETFSFMQQCNEVAVCSNSTFSWWGSFLSSCNTILLPNPWLNKKNLDLDLVIGSRSHWVEHDIWCWSIYSPTCKTFFHETCLSCDSFADTIPQCATGQYYLFVLEPIVEKQIIFDRIKIAMKELINLDILVLAYKGKAQRTHVKSTVVFKLKWIQDPTVFFISACAAKKWLLKRDWNQFARNFVLKDCLQTL
jgi:hypothetical protein